MSRDDEPIDDLDCVMTVDDGPEGDESSVGDQFDYRKCIYWLLIGLEVQNIEKFMTRCTPLNCHKLGIALTKAFKDKLNDRQGKAD